jgi:hypothetical protein
LEYEPPRAVSNPSSEFLRGNMSDEEFAPGGVLSEAGLARLRELMPEAAPRIQPGLRPAQILSLFSVRTFVNLVLAKRQGQSA